MTVLNLSSGGLKLLCNHETFVTIVPPEQRIPGQVNNVHVVIKFTLRRTGRRAMTIQSDALLVHSERLSQDSYHAGLQFAGMQQAVINRLEAYLEEMLTLQE